MLRSIAIGLFLAVVSFPQKKPVTVDAVVNAPSSRLGAITWAPDGERLVFTDRGELSLYDIHSGKERSVIALDHTKAFPKNTGVEAELTFVPRDENAAAHRAKFVEEVTPDARAITIRERQNFVELPPPPKKWTASPRTIWACWPP